MKKSLAALSMAAMVGLCVASQGCACGCGAHPGTSANEPSAASASQASGPGSWAAAPELGTIVPQPPQDPLTAQPLLGDPRLTAVAEATARGDAAAAAQAMRAALEQLPSSSRDRARWLYLAGRLSSRSGDPAAAAVAFDSAAKQDWALRDYAKLEAAAAYAEVGKHAEAIEHVRAVPTELPIATRARLLHAQLMEQTGAMEAAVDLWRSHLAQNKRGARWAEGGVKIAELLLAEPRSSERARDAVTLVRDVLIHAPAAVSASRAQELYELAITLLSNDEREAAQLGPMDRVDRASELGDAGRADDALAELDEVIKGLAPEASADRFACSAWSLRAELLGRNRSKRAASAEAYGKAVRACESDKVQLPWVLFRAARMSLRAGRASEGVARFTRIEKEFGSHRLADDARLYVARTVLDMKDEGRFSSLLAKMPHDYPDGDMLEDGLFELALHRMRKGNWAAAIEPLEDSVRLRPREQNHWSAGRGKYFLARALAATGRKQEAQAALREVVKSYPFSYYMGLAFSKLVSAQGGNEEELTRELLPQVPTEELVHALPATLQQPGFERAVELLRLGDADAGRQEVLALGLSADDADTMWAVALIYARLGAEQHAFRVARLRTGEWASSYPTGRMRKAWEMAYPRPYLDIVERETSRYGVPPALTYGIMREESVFEVEAVSSANAYGLMQLIMPTATQMAKPLGLDVTPVSLRRPEINIALGTKLLGSLRTSFARCPELAIPSYNAGAGATQRWLGARTGDEFDLWVENITYRETRDYTKRVLSSVMVYAHLYGESRLMKLPLEVRQ